MRSCTRRSLWLMLCRRCSRRRIFEPVFPTTLWLSLSLLLLLLLHHENLMRVVFTDFIPSLQRFLLQLFLPSSNLLRQPFPLPLLLRDLLLLRCKLLLLALLLLSQGLLSRSHRGSRWNRHLLLRLRLWRRVQ